MAARTDARLSFTKARAQSGRLTHLVSGASIYWRDGQPNHIYVTWACGAVTPHPAIPVSADQPLTCRGCAGAEAIANQGGAGG